MSCLYCYNRVVKNVRGTGQGGMYANRKKHFKRSDRRYDGKSVFARRKIFLRMRRDQKRSACRKLVCGSRKARTRFRNLYARVYPFKGFGLVKKAAKFNHPKAVMLLARSYYYGYGVRRSEKKAFRTWQKGAKLGITEAEYYLGLCYDKGIYVKRDVIEAKKHLYAALENGFDIAKTAIDDLSLT